MLSLAFGPLHLTPETFWGLTWAEYYRMLDGYLGREYTTWDHTRTVVAAIASIGRKKQVKPRQIMSLPHDRQSKKPTDRWQAFKRAKEKLHG